VTQTFFEEGGFDRPLRTTVTLQVNNGAVAGNPRLPREAPAGPYEKHATGKADGCRLVFAVRGTSSSKQIFDGEERTQ
jgi:hypothetical protein